MEEGQKLEWKYLVGYSATVLQEGLAAKDQYALAILVRCRGITQFDTTKYVCGLCARVHKPRAAHACDVSGPAKLLPLLYAPPIPAVLATRNGCR